MCVLVCMCVYECFGYVLGKGPSGRKYLLPRPSCEEFENTLWMMIFGAREREEEIRQEVKDRKEEWRKKESDLKDWEHDLEVRERRLCSQDEGLIQMMKDLRVKEGAIADREEEIKCLRNELEERVLRAREEHKREIKLVLVYVLCCVLKVNLY